MLRFALAALLAIFAADALAQPAQTFGPVKAVSFDLSGIAPLNTRYVTEFNPNTVLAGPGNSVSFCPALSCIRGPSDGGINAAFGDHQRASLLVSATTQDDAHSEEQTLAVTTTINKGYFKPYAASTAYGFGENLIVGSSFGGAIYRVVQAGVTGSGPPPQASAPTAAQGPNYTVTSGTARLQWVNAAAIASKVGIYNETKVAPGGGQSWAQANNYEMDPGVIPSFMVNTELDFTNNSGTDCAAGVSNCNGLYIRMNGTNRSTSAINVEGIGGGALFGARFTGPLSSNETLSLSTSGGQIGLGLGMFSPASYFVASIRDNATSPVSLAVGGTKSSAAILIDATAPTGLLMTGATFSQWQILGTGFSIDTVGNLTAASIRAPTSYTPPAASSTCSQGAQAWDANFEYRCISTNTWKRAALSTW